MEVEGDHFEEGGWKVWRMVEEKREDYLKELEDDGMKEKEVKEGEHLS